MLYTVAHEQKWRKSFHSIRDFQYICLIQKYLCKIKFILIFYNVQFAVYKFRCLWCKYEFLSTTGTYTYVKYTNTELSLLHITFLHYSLHTHTAMLSGSHESCHFSLCTKMHTRHIENIIACGDLVYSAPGTHDLSWYPPPTNTSPSLLRLPLSVYPNNTVICSPPPSRLRHQRDLPFPRDLQAEGGLGGSDILLNRMCSLPRQSMFFSIPMLQNALCYSPPV